MSATEGLRCSECGYEAKLEVKLFKTRRRWRGVFAALLSFVAGIALVGYHARDFDWNTIKPIWLLQSQGDAGTAQGLAARKELARRLGNDLLSEQEINDLVEHALAMQADPNAYWPSYRISRDLTWGIIVELA